jgi:hypothetical protein
MVTVLFQIYATQDPVLSSVLHLLKAVPGKELPASFSCSYAGFLLGNQDREITVDQNVVKQEMDFLSQFIVIASFIGGCPSEQMLTLWLIQLQVRIEGAVALGRNLGRGFLQ